MTSTKYDRALASYRGLVEDLSPTLPNNLQLEDVKLNGADLAIVIQSHGNLQFVADAFDAQDGDGLDTLDHLAIRATMPNLEAAIVSCGIKVMAAITAEARRVVFRDIEALREEQAANRERPYGVPFRSPREQAARDAGVSAFGEL